MTTELYRHFSAEGELLYVGISLSAVSRLCAHRTAPWFGRISKITIERYPTRKAAEAAEIAAIRKEKPIWNKAGKQYDRKEMARCRHAVGFEVKAIAKPSLHDQWHRWRYRISCVRCKKWVSVTSVSTTALTPLQASQDELRSAWDQALSSPAV